MPINRREFLTLSTRVLAGYPFAELFNRLGYEPTATTTSRRIAPETLQLLPQERGFISPQDLPVYAIPMERSGVFDRSRPVHPFKLSGGLYGYHGVIRVPFGLNSALELCHLDHLTGLSAAALAVISEGKYGAGKYIPETIHYSRKTAPPLYRAYFGGLDYYSPEKTFDLLQTIRSLLVWQQQKGGFKSQTAYSFHEIISPDKPMVSASDGADVIAYTLAQLVSLSGGQVIEAVPRPWYSPLWTSPYDENLQPVSVRTDLANSDFRFTLPTGFIHAQAEILAGAKPDSTQPVIWTLAFSPDSPVPFAPSTQSAASSSGHEFPLRSLPAAYSDAAEKLFPQNDISPFEREIAASPHLKSLADLSELMKTYARAVSPIEAKINSAKRLGTWLTQTPWWRDYTRALTPYQIQGLQSAIRHLDRYTYAYPDANGVPQVAQCVGAVVLLSQMPNGTDTPPMITVARASDLVPDEALNVRRGAVRDIGHQAYRLQSGYLGPNDYHPGDLFVLYSARTANGVLVVNRNDPGHIGVIVARKEINGVTHDLTFEINRGRLGVAHLRASSGLRFQSVVANYPLPAVKVVNLHHPNAYSR